MNKQLMLGVIIIVVFAATLWVFLRSPSVTLTPPLQKIPGITPGVSNVPVAAALTGEYLCLPHKNTSGPQTLECVLGLKTNEGNYYALDFGDLLQSGAIDFGTGTMILVSGMLVPIEQISSDSWQKYTIEAIMKVEKIEKV